MKRGAALSASALAVALAAAGCSSTNYAASSQVTAPSDRVPPSTSAPSPSPTPGRSIPPIPTHPQIVYKTLKETVAGIVLARSKQHGLEITSADWSGLSDFICKDLASGGRGLYTPNAAKTLPAKSQSELADLYLDGATQGQCTNAKRPAPPPGSYYASDISAALPMAMEADTLASQIDYSRRVAQYDRDLTEYGIRYGVDVRPLLDADDPGSGTGYSVTCADGTVSSSGGKQGACSHHGGVR
jgi:hypothetical protein